MVHFTRAITKEGYDELTGELDRLKNEARPAIARDIGLARAHGDLHQNAEYDAAKNKQEQIEARICKLDGILSVCRIIDPAEVAVKADGRCVFGAYVRLRDGEGGEISYRLVGEFEANVDIGRLSITSPTGRALLGKYAGEFVHVPAPGGVVEYELLEVRYEVESS